MRHWASHRVDVFLGVLGGIAATGLFFLVVLPGTAQVAHEVARKKPLTPAEIMERLGDYDQRIPDCVGLVPGLNGYAYARPKVTGGLEVVIVCR